MINMYTCTRVHAHTSPIVHSSKVDLQDLFPSDAVRAECLSCWVNEKAQPFIISLNFASKGVFMNRSPGFLKVSQSLSLDIGCIFTCVQSSSCT